MLTHLLDYWLLSLEIQGAVSFECVPFQIRGVAALEDKSLAKYTNCTARTVPLAEHKFDLPEGEVMALVTQKAGLKIITINLWYLVPWESLVDGKVMVLHGPLWGVVGMLKTQNGNQCVVTFTVDNESQDMEFVQK